MAAPSENLYSAWRDDRLDRRRATLRCRPNPRERIDYRVDFGRPVHINQVPASTALTIAFVPDKLILDPASLAPYLDLLLAYEWSTWEALAACLIDDLNNELVPRWLQVRLTGEDISGLARTLVMEDRQPDWGGTVPT